MNSSARYWATSAEAHAAEGVLVGRERPAVESLGPLGLAERVAAEGQPFQRLGDFQVIRAEGRLQDVQGAPEERVGILFTPGVPEDQRHVQQGPSDVGVARPQLISEHAPPRRNISRPAWSRPAITTWPARQQLADLLVLGAVQLSSRARHLSREGSRGIIIAPQLRQSPGSRRSASAAPPLRRGQGRW
jgi:hypothetical protein